MDDTYLWGENPAHLQRCLDILETLLRQHGLSINPKKTHIISNNPTNTQTFTVGGKTIVPDTGDTPVRVLGSPASFRGTTPQLAAEMRSRARTAYAQNKQVLTAPTPAKPRVQLHDISAASGLMGVRDLATTRHATASSQHTTTHTD